MKYRQGGSFQLDPASGGSGTVDSVVAGDNVTVDAADPANPVVSATGGGGGGLESVVAGTNILVDDTDPANPIVGFGGVEPPLMQVLPEVPGASMIVTSDDFLVIDGSTDSVQLSSASTLDVIGETVTVGPAESPVMTVNSDGVVVIGSVTMGGAVTPQIIVNVDAEAVALIGDASNYMQITPDGTTIASDGPTTVVSNFPVVLPHGNYPANLDATLYMGALIVYPDPPHGLWYSNGTTWVELTA